MSCPAPLQHGPRQHATGNDHRHALAHINGALLQTQRFSRIYSVTKL
jgi:hypothetical protein